MAIITEEEEPQSPVKKEDARPEKAASIPEIKPQRAQTPNPFAFWFYFTLAVSLITFLFASFSSLHSQDTKSWFLSLPHSLRQHYSSGRIVKVQTSPHQSPTEVFVFENGRQVSENVLFVHGFGLSSYSYREMITSLGSKGVRVIAIDLPGNGFSEKSRVEVEEGENGALGRLREIYGLIKEKGVFWAFDQMVETGQIPYEEIQSRILRKKSVKVIELDGVQVGRVLGQVIETMGLAPVHLVLHDSALAMTANWVLENSGSIRSITLIDTGLKPALPLWILDVPVVRELVLGFPSLYSRLISSCCSKRIRFADSDANRMLIKGNEGRRAVVGMGKKLNQSFDIAEWGSFDGMKDVPVQVLWSNGWNNEWSEEGQQIAKSLPQAKFLTHMGGRWPQEDVADEIAGNIVHFVSSLPKTVRQVEEEHIPEHIQKMLNEARENDHDHHHHHHHHHHHDGHDHGPGAGYMDAYGLNHGWAA